VGLGKDEFTLNEYAYRQIPLEKYKNLKQWDKKTTSIKKSMVKHIWTKSINSICLVIGAD